MNRIPADLIPRRLRQLDTMLRIRYFEERIDKLFAMGKLGGTCHLCIGQEAAAVGVTEHLKPGDKVVSSHRGHGHLIAMGGNLEKLFAELMEKETGYCRGRGGTQHLCDAAIGFMGTNGITGGGIPVGTGLGLAAKLDGRGEIAVSFFGDGAANQGTFHESLNVASVWKLPVVFVCENNLYAMSTPIARTTAVQDIAVRAASYGMPGLIADGNDIHDVEEKAGTAVKHCRSGSGPVLLEIKTYRHKGHSKSDARAYRTKEEERVWQENDCILKLTRKLKEMGYGKKVEEIDLRVHQIIAQAEAAAASAPSADINRVAQGVRA